jgi:hypothetical protein
LTARQLRVDKEVNPLAKNKKKDKKKAAKKGKKK